MSAIDIGAIMDGIAEAAEDGDVTTRVYAWPTESIAPPCAIVGYPTDLQFDATFGRGSDKAVFPLWVVVGKVADRTARDALSGLITGATGVKDAIDGTLGGACQTARVSDCQVELLAIGGISYLSARFDIEVYS
jgi:hypothetical protein